MIKKIIFILILFTLLNLFLSLLFFLKDSFYDENQIFRKYGKELVLKAYPNLNEDKVIDILNSTWGRPLIYDSTYFFKENSFKSEYVNINNLGIRKSNNQIVWPLKNNNFNVFIFGGSTTFGYGHEDKNTIPAFINKELSIINKSSQVYNFGAGFYFSTQEKLKFKQLINQNIKPDFVIFIDGLNEFYFTDNDLIEKQNELKNTIENRISTALIKLPFGRLCYSIYKLFIENIAVIKNDANFVKSCIDRYHNNQKEILEICKKNNIKSLFVIQPVPFYNYNLDNHLFINENEINKNVNKGYKILSKDTNIFWLGDLQKNDSTNNYVDEVHYTTEMNHRIAKEIAKEVIK